jgi:hypothetical protein
MGELQPNNNMMMQLCHISNHKGNNQEVGDKHGGYNNG